MSAPPDPAVLAHVVAYREPGRFAGWPANYGMWVWDDEIVLVFTLGYLAPAGAPGFHAVDGARGFETAQLRSRDGGRSWEREPFTGAQPSPYGLSVDEHLPAGRRFDAVCPAGPPAGSFRPLAAGLPALGDPDMAVLFGRTGLGGGARSWFYTSADRCRTWAGPYPLPDLGLPGIGTRTDVVRRPAGGAVLMLTVAKPDGSEGEVVAAAARPDGRIEVRAHVGAVPAGYRIMPATVALPDGGLVTAVRCAGPARLGRARRYWIEVYRSADDGRSWELVAPEAARSGRGGNPPTLTLLPGGRLCLVYGYRDPPFGIRARTSTDAGATWSAETILRADGGCHDLGYPRTVVRADGALVTAYYFADAPDAERYIAVSIWRP